MTQEAPIPEKIFERWCQKLSEDQTVPASVVERLKKLREQQNLSNVETLDQIMSSTEGENNDQAQSD